jgi:toxin HigB-1
MISSFADNETKKIFFGFGSRKLPITIQRSAMMKLQLLNAAKEINELRLPPGNRLEKLTGDRANQYSIRINGQWRICFEWENGTAYNVGIVDYH